MSDNRYAPVSTPPPLFDTTDYDIAQREWVGMPEFAQSRQKAYATIIFRFSSEDDLQEFADLIKMNLTRKTKSAWFPPITRGLNANKRWVDEP